MDLETHLTAQGELFDPEPGLEETIRSSHAILVY